MRTFLVVMLSFYSATTLSAYAEPLTLAEALAKRAACSQTLKMAGLDEQIADLSVTAARSRYLPRVDIQGGYTAQQAPQSITTPFGPFETQDADYGFFSASLNQTIYDFGRTSSRYAQAQATHDVSRFSYRTQEQDIFLRTVISYFHILQEQKLLLEPPMTK